MKAALELDMYGGDGGGGRGGGGLLEKRSM